MEDLLREYLPIIIFLGIAIALGLVFLIAAAVLAVSRPDAEKISADEVLPRVLAAMKDAGAL